PPPASSQEANCVFGWEPRKGNGLRAAPRVLNGENLCRFPGRGKARYGLAARSEIIERFKRTDDSGVGWLIDGSWRQCLSIDCLALAEVSCESVLIANADHGGP